MSIVTPVDGFFGPQGIYTNSQSEGVAWERPASVELFDLYRGESLGAGRKSLAFHVVLRSETKTLTDKDAAKFLTRSEKAAERLGGELRRD